MSRSVEDQIAAELRKLRQGPGLTVSGISPRLRSLLGDVTSFEAYSSIQWSLQIIGKGIQARALRNAFAIGMDDPGTLTDRRTKFAADNNRDSPDTVENWENAAIDELAHWVLNEVGGLHLKSQSISLAIDASQPHFQLVGVTIDSITDDDEPISESFLNKQKHPAAQFFVYQLLHHTDTLIVTARFEPPENVGQRQPLVHFSMQLVNIAFREHIIPLERTERFHAYMKTFEGVQANTVIAVSWDLILRD